MTQPLRVGVAGGGAMARQVHLPLLQRHRNVKLVAIADSDKGVLSSLRHSYPDTLAFGSIEEMVSKAGLDAVVIALPPALHAPAACAVLDAGLHLYLEKPMATSLEESAAIMRAWRRSGRVGVMGFNARANPLFVHFRQLVRTGRAGTMVYLQTFMATGTRALPEWKRQRMSGGGALLDLGVHHIDLARFLTGRDITGARASVSSRVSEHDTMLLELQMSGGIGAHLFFSLAAAEGDHVEVHGDRSRLSVDRYTSVDVRIIDNPGLGLGVLGRVVRHASAMTHLPRAWRARRSPLREPGYAVLLDRFIQAARTGVGAGDVPDLTDGFAVSAVVAAAERSVMTGRMETPTALSDAPRLVHATP